MNISSSWLIYIVVTAIAYFILSFIAKNLVFAVKLMISLLIGALAVFLSVPSLDIETGSERVWLGILLLLAYLSPIIVGLYIIWKGGLFNGGLCMKKTKSK